MSDLPVKPLTTDAYDSRLASRHLRSGRIQPAEMKKFLDDLPDSADNGEEVVVILGDDGSDRYGSA